MEDLRITGLTLNNVGVFERLELSFKKKPLKDKAEIHIFTGENGTGKTTLLEALTYFDYECNKLLKQQRKDKEDEDMLVQKVKREKRERDDEFDERDDFYRMKGHRNREEKYSIELYLNKREMFFSVHRSPHLTNSEFIEEYYNEKYFAKYMHTYNFFAYDGHRQLRDTKVEVLKDFEYNPITEALTFNKTDVNVNLFQWIANNKTRAALSFQKGNKKDSDKYLASIQKIETAISEIIGRRIEFVIEEYSLNVMVKLDDEPIFYNTLADGYKSVISWLTDLVFRLDYMPKEGQENFTLFLDEIDVHLHPAAQRRILPVIQKLFPKAQIFLTTHSPFVIGSVDDAWVYKFKLNENGKSVLDGEPFLTEDAKSYRFILDEVFDIKNQFGIEVEKKLEGFYLKRDEIIKNYSSPSLRELVKISRELASQSTELQAIMGNELRQLSRILKKEITL